MRYLVSIGSNCKKAAEMMARADRWISERFSVVESSGVYSSKALNGISSDYLNEVIVLESGLSVTEITAAAKDFERQCGRSELSKSAGAIEMDIDIIQVDNTILRPSEFTRAYFLTGLSKLRK